MMRRLVFCASLLALSSCAASPDNIKADYIPDTAYASLDCKALGAEEVKQGDIVNELSDKQRRAHKTDTWGVIATGVPLSELTGSDVKGALARAKGKLDAIHRVQMASACPGARQEPAPSTTNP